MVMAISLDITVIAIIAAFGWKGWRRGILPAVISAGITLLAALVAFFASAPLSESVYDNNIRTSVVEVLQSGLEGIDAVPIIQDVVKEQLNVDISDDDIDRIVQSDDVKSELQSIASENGEYISNEELNEKWDELVSVKTLTELVGDKVPEEIIENVSNALSENEENISTAIKVVCDKDRESAAKKVEEKLFRAKVTVIVRAVVALCLFVVIAVALQAVYFILRQIKVIPPLRILLKMPGALVGTAEGILLFIVLGAGLGKIIDNSYGILEFLGADIIDKTFIFKLFVR